MGIGDPYYLEKYRYAIRKVESFAPSIVLKRHRASINLKTDSPVGRVSDSVTRRIETVHRYAVGLRLSPNPTYATTQLSVETLQAIIEG